MITRPTFPSFIPFVGETESIAREKQAFYNELADPISGLITLSVHTDHGFSQYDRHKRVEDVQVGGRQGLFDVPRRLSERDIGKLYAQRVLLLQFVGTWTYPPIRSHPREVARAS